jgi:stage V sporulation protein AC
MRVISPGEFAYELVSVYERGSFSHLFSGDITVAQPDVTFDIPCEQEYILLHYAYVTGGAVCALGQFVLGIFIGRGLDINAASAPTLAIMILLGIVLTALGIYDEFAEFAGAGAAVPITGFANTIAASAMDFKHEGWVLGMGAKMFIIAGPVIVYGILSGVFAAFIKYITRL